MTILQIRQKHITVRMFSYLITQLFQHSRAKHHGVIQQLQIFATTVVKGVLKIEMGINRFS